VFSFYNIFIVGLVYIVGGLNEMNAELQSIDIYNPVTERWTHASDMQMKRAHVGIAAVNGFIYAVGGYTEKDGALASVERYSITEVSYHLYQLSVIQHILSTLVNSILVLLLLYILLVYDELFTTSEVATYDGLAV